MIATDAPSLPRIRPAAVAAAHVRRDFAVAWSYRTSFFVGLFGSLHGLIVYFFIAKLIDESQFPDSPELANGYLAFVVVGNAVTSLIAVGLTDPPGRMQRAQSMGTIEALATTPVSLWYSTVCASIYNLIYETLGAVVTVGLTMAFLGVRLDVTPSGALVAAGGILATLVLFASVGLLVAAVALVIKRVGPILGLATAGLAFASGALFPLDLLPAPLDTVAKSLPFAWSVDVVRLSLLAGEAPIGRLLVLVATVIVTFPLAIAFFNVALKRTKRLGTLSHY